ncbi:MAG: hypothetical protein LIO93_08915 [Bacteroidales bacterium]|nr:hypothetical protein [Bacteroidales bacterium]
MSIQVPEAAIPNLQLAAPDLHQRVKVLNRHALHQAAAVQDKVLVRVLLPNPDRLQQLLHPEAVVLPQEAVLEVQAEADRI